MGEVEVPFDEEQTYTKVIEFLSKENHVDGIFVVGSGQSGTARALQDLRLSSKIKLAVFDATSDIVEYIKKGVISCSICVDQFGQGYETIIYLYNYLMTRKLLNESELWSKLYVVDQENMQRILN